MGLYIKGIEMPKNCYECYFCIYGYCVNLNRYVENSQERDSDCPLVPVPTHGRLIDAGELYALYNGEDIDDEHYHVSIPCIKQNITDMLTILESDVGECITTNADYIRHMCDEKLAWWLDKICPDAPFAFAYPEK